MKTHAVGITLLAIGLGATSGVAAQTGKTASAKPQSVAPSEDSLRIRLQFNVHDETAHKQLIALLDKRYAFRAMVAEDAQWIKNNPDDYWALTELVSYAKKALHDPEFAIMQERSFLARASRTENDQQYDITSSMLAADLVARGRPAEALEISEKLVHLNPEDSGLWADRSRILVAAGRLDDAIGSLRHSLTLDPSSEGTHDDLADLLARAGDLGEAETEYRAALSLYVAKYKNGETTNSVDSFVKRMVEIEAKSQEEHVLAQMHLKLARFLALKKKWTDAVAETQAALDADKNGFEAFYVRAQVYDAAGNPERGEKSRRMAQEAISKLATDTKWPKEGGQLDPRLGFLIESPSDDSPARNPGFPKEVISILEPRLTNLYPLERMALAYAYLDVGRINDAMQQWDQGIAADSKLDTPAVHGNFGEALLKAHSLKEALPHLRRAYELDPQNMTYRLDYEAVKRAVGITSPTR